MTDGPSALTSGPTRLQVSRQAGDVPRDAALRGTPPQFDLPLNPSEAQLEIQREDIQGKQIKSSSDD